MGFMETRSNSDLDCVVPEIRDTSTDRSSANRLKLAYSDSKLFRYADRIAEGTAETFEMFRMPWKNTREKKNVAALIIDPYRRQGRQECVVNFVESNACPGRRSMMSLAHLYESSPSLATRPAHAMSAPAA